MVWVEKVLKSIRACFTGRPLRLLVLLTLIAPVLGALPTVPAGPRAQATLLALAAARPEQALRVIVQKAGRSSGPEKLVTQLGGKVTKDLHIINAFAALVPGKAILDLANASGVRWVSLDATTRSSAVGSATQFTTWATQYDAPVRGSLVANFNSSPISAGKYIWFSTVMTASGVNIGSPVKLSLDNTVIRFSANGAQYKLKVPPAVITFDPAAQQTTTTFTTVTNTWTTRVSPSASGFVFATGIGFKVPRALPGNISQVTWTGRFVSDTPGVAVTWKAGAAVYSSFSTNYNALGIKPVDGSTANPYANSDPAATPENYKAQVLGGAQGTGGTNYTGSQTPTDIVIPARQFSSVESMIDSPAGPNQTYAWGASAAGSVTGFAPQTIPDVAIAQVELVLQAYVPTPLATGDDLIIIPSTATDVGSGMVLPHNAFDTHISAANAGPIYVDITASRAWDWSDFTNDLKVTLDQSCFASGAAHRVYYDAVGLRVTTADPTPPASPSPTQSPTPSPTNTPPPASPTGWASPSPTPPTSATPPASPTMTATPSPSPTAPPAPTSTLLPSAQPGAPLDVSRLVNVYNQAVRALDVWNEAPNYQQGQGVTVAVVDSGVFNTDDLEDRLVANVNFNAAYHDSADAYGHGTLVTGIAAGDGTLSGGTYIGIAPRANIVNVRVSDDQGGCSESDLIAGLQWVNDNRVKYNIRVINLSLNATVAQSYNTDPLDAAVEILWFNGIVVIASGGNNGTGVVYPPANDPFVITVGAVDDRGTVSQTDDIVAAYSAYGTDETGGAKPDLVAPGTNIIGLLPNNDLLRISVEHPANRINSNYFRMSGTSMAAPVVAGAAAMLIASNPNLTPDQVKYHLKATAVRNPSQWPGYDPVRAGMGYLDIYAAIHSSATESANTGIRPSALLSTGGEPIDWGDVAWNSVAWNSVAWNSVAWNSVAWNSDYWGP